MLSCLLPGGRGSNTRHEARRASACCGGCCVTGQVLWAGAMFLRRTFDVEGEEFAVGEGHRDHLMQRKAKAVSQPRRQWEHKAKAVSYRLRRADPLPARAGRLGRPTGSMRSRLSGVIIAQRDPWKHTQSARKTRVCVSFYRKRFAAAVNFQSVLSEQAAKSRSEPASAAIAVVVMATRPLARLLPRLLKRPAELKTEHS